MPPTPPQLNSLIVTGKIGNYVYQRVAAGLGNVPGDPTRTLQKHLYVAHNLSNTPAQQAHRAKFALGMPAWHTLTPVQKWSYRKKASRIGLTGYNLHMRIWMKTI